MMSCRYKKPKGEKFMLASNNIFFDAIPMLDNMASRLEESGFIKEASSIDMVSNTLEKVAAVGSRGRLSPEDQKALTDIVSRVPKNDIMKYIEDSTKAQTASKLREKDQKLIQLLKQSQYVSDVKTDKVESGIFDPDQSIVVKAKLNNRYILSITRMVEEGRPQPTENEPYEVMLQDEHGKTQALGSNFPYFKNKMSLEMVKSSTELSRILETVGKMTKETMDYLTEQAN